MKNTLLLLFLLSFSCNLVAQQTISIKNFGAKGDGKTNDHEAFVKASNFIQSKGGNCTLKIPYGTYIVGKQIEGNNWLLEGEDILHFENCKNIKIEGAVKNGKWPIIKYKNNLYFGSFITNGSNNLIPKIDAIRNYFDKKTCAYVGTCFYFLKCDNIKVSNVEINGNVQSMIMGGNYGDAGKQLSHRGFYIISCTNLSLNNISAHHNALDGIEVNSSNDVTISNFKSNFNARQGLSWTGGKNLTVSNSSFNHTGRSTISSPPSAGLDIECEDGGVITNGVFNNCEFVNNVGCGVIAESGSSKNISFNKCTFWGVANWSAWVGKSNYTFTNCNLYGSFVHGYVTSNYEESTKFYSCTFEDKPYNGMLPYGKYLLECDGKKLMVFENCVFTANHKKIMWYNGAGLSEKEKAIFKNCTFNVKTNALLPRDFYAVIRRANMIDTKFNLSFPQEKLYYLNEENNTIVNRDVKRTK